MTGVSRRSGAAMEKAGTAALGMKTPGLFADYSAKNRNAKTP
jgi:hypothetical protein